jgi:hypothetical protein
MSLTTSKSPIKAHAAVMFAAARPVTDYGETRRLFGKRRYEKHSIFLSRHFPQDDCHLVMEICGALPRFS